MNLPPNNSLSTFAVVSNMARTKGLRHVYQYVAPKAMYEWYYQSLRVSGLSLQKSLHAAFERYWAAVWKGTLWAFVTNRKVWTPARLRVGQVPVSLSCYLTQCW